MNSVRICLVGAGRAGMVHANNILHYVCDATLACIVEPSVEVAREAITSLGVPCYPNIDDAIRKEKFDAVIITSPTFTHAEITKKAAMAKKHVFCEKPMALNLKESDEMISICREYRVVLQIGFMRRFDKAFQRAKRMVEEGKIGKIAIIKSTGRGPGLPPKWACDPKKSLGMLAEVNSHDFDSIRWFGGGDFSRVYAEASTFKCFELKNEYPNFYDNSIVSIRLTNGTLALLDGSCPVEYGYDARVEILGTEGVIMIGDIKDEMISACTKKGEGVTYPAFLSWRDRFREAYIEEIKHFINCVLENRDPMVSGEDGKKAVEAVLAATKSLLTQKPVEMPLKDDLHF
ncbi:MAG: Gfo/Idh/MocA family oxidoreductase [Candidatus Bathyarchaeia archaeon]